MTCVSHNSMPAAQLQWYINGEKADPVHIKSYEPLMKRGLLTSRLGLSFKVNGMKRIVLWCNWILNTSYAMIKDRNTAIISNLNQNLGTPQAFSKGWFKTKMHRHYIHRLLEIKRRVSTRLRFQCSHCSGVRK